MLTRIDPRVKPIMYRCAVVSDAELAQLRRVTKVIRKGHVKAIEADRIVLDQGEIPTSPQQIHVHCSADGFPRLPEQPIFYPVLNEDYAMQIARDWNSKDERSGFVGYVLRFQVRRDFLDGYPIKVVGSALHRELWIPADELSTFNENIIGKIEVIGEFRASGS